MMRLLRCRISRVGVALWVLGLAACTTPRARPDPDIITIAVRAAPNNLDPRLANDETTARIGQLVLNGLMELDDNMRARPKLAERLEQTSPTTYVAHLRRGVRFHDGHELSSRDVVYSYRRLLDPEFTSPYKSAFRPLAAIEAVDEYTVLFTLKEPFAAFPAQLVEPGIVPDGAGAEMSTAPVGTGLYRFIRYVVDDRVEFAVF